MKTKVKIKCGNCGSDVDVEDLLVKQFESSIRAELQSELQKQEALLQKQKEEYKILRVQLDLEKDSVNEMVNAQVKSILRTKEQNLREAIKKEIATETSAKLDELEDELTKKSKQLQLLNGTQAELERLKRDMEEQETRIVLQKERELTERLEQAKLSIKEQVQQENFLKLKEREKVIEDLKLKLEDAKRQAELGSVQLQGEIQELEILDMLKEFHPYDEITQSKKGTNAADILQIVKTHKGAECGSIYYESKRTKSWSKGWIDKFKQDNIETKADILVLVTNALPKEIQRYGIIDGIWVCGFNDVKELSLVLRYGLLKLQQVAITQHGKESKMELLYNYLTSVEFKNVFEAIINGFKNIQDSHHSEKLKMQRLWKEREKQLERILSNTVEFYGSIRAIAGSAILEIPLLNSEPAA